MAIQAQMCPENIGLPLGESQDWFIDHNNNNNNNNNNMFFNGCGFNELSSNLQQKQQQQQQFQYHQQQLQQYLVQHQNLQQKNQAPSSDNSFVFSTISKTYNPSTTTSSATTSSDHMSMGFSPSLGAQLEKQRQEIDRYISLQNERLKLAIQEQRKQQLATILRKIEAKAVVLMRQKDEEIAKANKRRMELEEFMRKMEVEKQAWQRIAAENEAMAVSLNNTLEQLKEHACCLTTANGVDDAESCCNDNDCNEEEEERERGGNRGEQRETGVCRVCNSGKSFMLFLPCRHLCCCKACEPFLDACPLCKSLKKASIEALIS